MTCKEKILKCLNKFGPMTDEQMCDKLGLNPSSVRTRRFELEMDGYVGAVDKTHTKSGRETWVWDITGKKMEQ